MVSASEEQYQVRTGLSIVHESRSILVLIQGTETVSGPIPAGFIQNAPLSQHHHHKVSHSYQIEQVQILR